MKAPWRTSRSRSQQRSSEGYAVNGEWTDDAGAQPDAAWTMDRFDFVSELLGR